VSTSKKLREELTAKRADAQKLWDEFVPLRDAIGSDDFDAKSDHGKQALDKAHETSKAYTILDGECKELFSSYEKALEMDGLSQPSTSPLAEKASKDREMLGLLTPGQRVVRSDTYKALTEGSTLQSQNQAFRMEVKAMTRDEHINALRSRYDMKTLLQTENPAIASDSTGTLLNRPQRLPGFLEMLLAPLKLRNLITVGATDSNTVEWVRQTAVATGAREVAEATSTSGSSGTKPESGMSFDLQNTVVQTIAHWIPATRAALADMAQLQTIIDSQLLDGIARRLNTQILMGDGNAPNLAGILSHPILSQDDVVLADPGARKIERVLAAITKIRLAFLEPTAILMHPNDFQAVRLSKDSFGQYYFGSPSSTGETHLWGLPVIEDVTAPEGEPIVGDWSQAILYVREDVNILASDSHSDFFVRNMIVILGEGRYALAVPRPDAFCSVDFTTNELMGPS
jgi:HK97 family phage major capsid protein